MNAKPETFSLFGRDLFGDAVQPPTKAGPLAQRFTLPPLSVLNARDGAWQERKRAWIVTGIQSEIGRDEILRLSETSRRLAGGYTEADGEMKGSSGTSVFDPVLCELAYSWFAPPGGTILDPFAGGSVRGIVAALLGYRYTGVDLRPEQVAANEEQAARITPGNRPRWIVGDAREALRGAERADFVFSCPPYGDLERYSDDPRDLSAMDHLRFLDAYREIIGAACAALKPDRFACFTVGDFRDRKGIYRNFPADTIAAFQSAGAALYNEAILVTAVGSLPIRVGRMFAAGRKLGKTHQNVLVFVKGDPKRAADACAAEAP